MISTCTQHQPPSPQQTGCAFRLRGWGPQGCRSEKVEPESTFGEMQPVMLYHPAMKEDKNITRKRGGHFSLFDNIKRKV